MIALVSMFSGWFTGNLRDNDNADNTGDTHEEQFMPYEMDLDDVYVFNKQLRAYSSEQLPESTLREQLEYGGKGTLVITQTLNTQTISVAPRIGAA